ncbi:MAG: biotin--[acetyl-CoA-carboxylase] ligase, partial [Chitinophagales bacterium]|nr:biotin--[acetyl-CoA-carboxylase] ligase [Chitinophagales bacterium]
KGYSGNIWESESGKNLLMSVIFFPNFLSPRLHFFLNQVASLAVADTVKEFVKGKEIKIKWPNDVFAGKKKIAGILIENSVKGNSIQHSIIGIGLNVNQKNFTPQLLHATSIFKILGKEILVDDMMNVLFSMLEARYLQLKQNRIEQLQ